MMAITIVIRTSALIKEMTAKTGRPMEITIKEKTMVLAAA
jgi:hypothetical protein